MTPCLPYLSVHTSFAVLIIAYTVILRPKVQRKLNLSPNFRAIMSEYAWIIHCHFFLQFRFLVCILFIYNHLKLVIYLSVRPPTRPSVHLSIHKSIYGCTVLVDLGRFFSLLIYTQSVGLLGRGISPSQGLCLHTEQHKHRINTHRYPCLEWDSNPRYQCSSGRRRCMT
jgi:hypothetical protein